MDNLNELFEEQVKDLYNAEKQLEKALPKMAKKAAATKLKKAFEDHLRETEEQIARLEQIAETWGFKPGGKKCKAMEGLIEEGKEVLKEKGNSDVLDCALIAAAQKVEHYEISGYGSLRAIAEKLGDDETVTLITTTLEEESKADELLSEISENDLLESAPLEEEDDDDEDEEDLDTSDDDEEEEE